MKNKNFSPLIIGLTVLVTLLSAEPNPAQDTAETIADLKKQIETLQKRVDELETEKQKPVHMQKNRYQPGMGMWDPFTEINRIQEEMDMMFQNSFGRSGGMPGMFSSNMTFNTDIDLKETDKGYEIRFDMKGLDKDKVDIQINADSVTVKGEYSRQEKEEGQDRMMNLQSFGSFMKTIPLPENADTENVTTEKTGDTLIIRMPKKFI
jgi:HSP20 family protein